MGLPPSFLKCVVFGCDIFEKTRICYFGIHCFGPDVPFREVSCLYSSLRLVILSSFTIFLSFAASNFGSSGFIWDHLGPPGPASLIISANHLDSSGNHLGSFGAIWNSKWNEPFPPPPTQCTVQHWLHWAVVWLLGGERLASCSPAKAATIATTVNAKVHRVLPHIV